MDHHESSSSITTENSTKRQRMLEETHTDVRPIRDKLKAGTTDLPSIEIGLLLLETYFKRV
jgi:hypothetical protein